MPKLRPYMASDWERFLELEISTALESLPEAASDRKAKLRAQWPGKIRDRYQWSEKGPTVDQSLLLVLEDDDGQFAGHLWLTEQEDFFSAERKLYIVSLALETRHRGRGWGKLLMLRAEEEAKQRGLNRIGLGVASQNENAIGLYRALGYEATRYTMELTLD